MQSVHSVVAQACRVICIVLVNRKLSGSGIEALQTRGLRANPQRSLGIFLDRDIDQGTALLVGLIDGEVRSCRIKTIETIKRGGPQCTGMINEQLINNIVAQTETIVWVVEERLHRSGLRVETGQSMAVATEPKKPRSVFDDCNRARTDSLACVWVEGVSSCLAVEAVQRVNRGDPQDSRAILIDAVHHRPAQTIGVAGHMLEFLKERRSG